VRCGLVIADAGICPSYGWAVQIDILFGVETPGEHCIRWGPHHPTAGGAWVPHHPTARGSTFDAVFAKLRSYVVKSFISLVSCKNKLQHERLIHYKENDNSIRLT